MMIKTKSIYDPVSKDDGIRVLVTRYWPRGIKKEKKDYWFKDLGTDKDLITLWKAGKLTWADFKESYRKEFKTEGKKKSLKDLKGLIDSANGKDVTLLCTCMAGERCHRNILKEMLEK